MPNAVLMLADGGAAQEQLAKWLPFIAGDAHQIKGQATAYICENLVWAVSCLRRIWLSWRVVCWTRNSRGLSLSRRGPQRAQRPAENAEKNLGDDSLYLTTPFHALAIRPDAGHHTTKSVARRHCIGNRADVRASELTSRRTSSSSWRTISATRTSPATDGLDIATPNVGSHRGERRAFFAGICELRSLFGDTDGSDHRSLSIPAAGGAGGTDSDESGRWAATGPSYVASPR